MSLEAAEKLAAEGFDVEVIDLRSLVPLDEESIIQSIKKTHRCLIVHEDKVFGGFGGELVALINDLAFEQLDAPVKRIGSPFMPVGFNRILERAILPDTERIYQGMISLLRY
jgi:2-oxoisovalerate dehydrogenase E1 component